MGWPMMVERSLQGKPYVTNSGETNNNNNGFLNEKGEQKIEKFVEGGKFSALLCEK